MAGRPTLKSRLSPIEAMNTQYSAQIYYPSENRSKIAHVHPSFVPDDGVFRKRCDIISNPTIE